MNFGLDFIRVPAALDVFVRSLDQDGLPAKLRQPRATKQEPLTTGDGAIDQISQTLTLQREKVLHPFKRVVPGLEHNPPLASDPVAVIGEYAFISLKELTETVAGTKMVQQRLNALVPRRSRLLCREQIDELLQFPRIHIRNRPADHPFAFKPDQIKPLHCLGF